ncbi:MaoC family dehydratase [Paraburkholderia sp. RL17-347-BIC-D]|uniref:MaoC family dehydratase n=1 Tax=Paraburkholderia sp. RL17-347-BIC-D TaxID=3031632 RepID=UPI0038BB3DFC
MKFDEFSGHQVIEAGPYIVTEAEVLEFANRFDPQWFHTDQRSAEQGRWGGLIASGWHTCSIAMRLAYDAALSDSGSWGSPGLDYLKWPEPVRPGDFLTFRATVIDTRRSRSVPSLGIVKWRWQLFNQHQTDVFDTVANSFFEVN